MTSPDYSSVGWNQWQAFIRGTCRHCFCQELADKRVECMLGRRYVHAKECCKCHQRVYSYEPASI